MDEQAFEHLRRIQKQPFGMILAKLREEKGLSQGELAKAVGISRPYLTLIENGSRTPSSETAHRLASALGVEPKRVAWMTGDITAEDIARMQKMIDVIRLIKPRLSQDEWASFKDLLADTEEMLGWLDRAATTVSSGEPSPVEPAPGWDSLSKDDRRMMRRLIKRLAECASPHDSDQERKRSAEKREDS